MTEESKFSRVHCRDCGNEQIIFNRANIIVNCDVAVDCDENTRFFDWK